MKDIVVETPRLILRRWRPDDLTPMTAINADPRVMEFFPAPLTREETQAMIELIENKTEKDGFGFWAAELKSSGELIGFIGLNIPGYPVPFAPCVEIGWRLAFAHWGKGYAPEGARAALEFGFKNKGLQEIVSFTTTKNQRSRTVMEKIGMLHDRGGDFDHPKLSADHPLLKHVLYRVSSAQFRS